MQIFYMHQKIVSFGYKASGWERPGPTWKVETSFPQKI